MGYKTQAYRGISWMGLLRLVTRVITFLRLAILGRLLTPAQFGVFGIASLLLSFLEILTETGINVFLVQEKEGYKAYINSAWAVSILRGIILALLIVLLAPFISSFFQAPEAYNIILLIAFVPFIRGFINPSIIIFQKELQFHKEFMLRSALFFTEAAVSMLFAYYTRSAVSFVYGLIASAIVEVILSFAFISIWPALRFEYEKIKKIIRRGGWVTLTGIFAYFADNGDNITVGKMLGSASLGIYQVAYKFSTLPISEITNVVNQVTFPVYTKFSDDKRRLWTAFLKINLLSAIAAIGMGAIIYVFAEPIILAFMGEQWVSAVPAVQVLAIFGVLRAIFGNFSALFLSKGRQDYVAQMTFFRVVALAVTVIPFVSMYGLVGAGYAMLLSIIAEIPIVLYFSYKVFTQSK